MPVLVYFAVIGPALLGLLFMAQAYWGPGTPPRVEAPRTQKILITRDTTQQQRYANEVFVAPDQQSVEVTSSNRAAETTASVPAAGAQASAAQASAAQASGAKLASKQKKPKSKVARSRGYPQHAGYGHPGSGRPYGQQPRYARMQGGFPFFNGF